MKGKKHMTDASGRSGSSAMDSGGDRGMGTAVRNKRGGGSTQKSMKRRKGRAMSEY